MVNEFHQALRFRSHLPRRAARTAWRIAAARCGSWPWRRSTPGTAPWRRGHGRKTHGKPWKTHWTCGEMWGKKHGKLWNILRKTPEICQFFPEMLLIFLGGIHWRSVVEIDGFRSKKWGLGVIDFTTVYYIWLLKRWYNLHDVFLNLCFDIFWQPYKMVISLAKVLFQWFW